MYSRTNPAVIKAILLRLTKSELLIEIEVIKSMIIESEAGNKRTMLIKLYVFAQDNFSNAKTSSYKL
jgi:hypothetical protein